MDYKFQRHRSDKIPREKILQELENAAKIYHYNEFGYKDFNKVANISSGTVKNEFASWKNALTELRKRLKEKDLDLIPRKSRSQLVNWSNEQLFEEMERIWKKSGHRPSCVEWKAASSKISLGTYRYRFNGWQNACLKFMEYKMGEKIIIDNDYSPQSVVWEPKPQNQKQKKTIKLKSGSTRTISAGIRIQVLNRNNFCCVFCGRSPATDIGVKLHIDHIIPFSKGGKSTIDNLQTLCQDCNLGKSDKSIRKSGRLG